GAAAGPGLGGGRGAHGRRRGAGGRWGWGGPARLRRGGPSAGGVWGAMSGPPITLGACRSIEGCHGFAGAPRACGGYGGPFEAPHVTRVCSGGGGGAPLARPVDAEPAVPQVRRAVRRRGLLGAA